MKTYTCICGQVFDNPQKFNGHKQGCVIHITNKYGTYDNYLSIKNRNHNKGKIVRERSQLKKEAERASWIAEKHTCERCGKLMTEKYGSGRFCSRECANTRLHSQSSKEKLSNTLRNKTYTIQEENRKAYNSNPSLCVICGSPIEYEKRTNKTCCKQCADKLLSLKAAERCSKKIHHANVRGRYKYGTYKGIHCDSSWELAFVMYLIDHNISFERNTSESFRYVYKGKTHSFFPDFIIDGVYYEIKNYKSELTDAKIKCFPDDRKIVVLYYEDVLKYIRYATDTYGKDYYKWYDSDCPSCLDKSDSI